jgi:hypothetical protein
MLPIPCAVTAASLAALLGLQACSQGAGLAQGSLAAGAAAPPTAGFAAARPDKLDYIPVAAPGTDAAPPARAAADIAAAEAELEALRARNEARGAAVRRAAGAAKPAP